MAVIQREIAINQPAEKVFALLDDPDSLKRYAPGVDRVSDVRRTDKRVGDTMRVTYSVLGLRFPTKFTIIEYAAPSKMVARMEGGMTGTMDWSLKSDGASTNVLITIDYQMKGGILGKAMNAVLVERMNEKNAERILENLKMVVEGA